jgi:hypothetical protein
MVFTVTPGKYVTGRCGQWLGSQPLGTGGKLSAAISILANAIDNRHKTEEIIIVN